MERNQTISPPTPITIVYTIFKVWRKPYQWSLLIVLLSIFAAETATMMIIYTLDLPFVVEALIDALLLVVLSYPILYVRFLKPLFQQYESVLAARQTAQTLTETSLELSQTLDLKKVFDILLDRIAHLTPNEFSSLYLLQTPSRLVIQATRGYERINDDPNNETTWFDPAENAIVFRILREEKGVVVPDIHNEPAWTFRRQMVDVHSWMGIPLIAGGKVIGLLGLGTRETNFYTPEHLLLSEGLVGQAAVAIQNAWLFEQIKIGNEQLHTLTRRLVEVQEFERANLARELHDEVGQSLTSLIVDLKRLEQKSNQPEAVLCITGEMNTSLEAISENLHRLAANLRPAALDHFGLEAALRQHVEAISRRHTVKIRLNVQELQCRLPQDMETFLYRIVQEALNNVLRHAKANNVDVVIQQRAGSLILIIEDDGIGFDVETALRSGRLGLFGMRERAETFGGSLLIESSLGKGTTILVEVPNAITDSCYG